MEVRLRGDWAERGRCDCNLNGSHRVDLAWAFSVDCVDELC